MASIVTITLPDIGEGVVEGEVIAWQKQVGDSVKKDEGVVTVMTDKATVELPSPFAGRLVKQYFQPGQIAIKDKPLYDIETDEVVIGAKKTSSTPVKTEPSSLRETPSSSTSSSIKETLPTFSSSPSNVLATPATRKLAQELNVNLQLVKGTGKEGRITDADVVRFHASQGRLSTSRTPSGRAAPDIRSSTPILHLPDDEQQPLIGLRHIIAEKMVESKFIIPHFSYFDQVDATRLVQLRDKMKGQAEKENIKLTYMPFFIRALSKTLLQFPQCNASVDLEQSSLVIHKHHHIGIAAKIDAGLVVAVLKNVQEMSLNDLIRAYDALMKKAREGKLERSDMQDSTITITNFGAIGGQWATPIINYPEVAILGVAKIQKTPVVINNAVAIREMLNLSWSFDHRVIDGDQAANFSNAYIQLLENPAQIL